VAPRLLLLVLVSLAALSPSLSRAQERVVEEPDPTRLDVERLPPEAIEITRDLYSHGFYLEAKIGARGFLGGVGRLSGTGPYLQIGAGYELFRWLWIGVGVEGSIHRTLAPTPPSATVFEVVGFYLDLRLQANVSARAALWLGGAIGFGQATSEVLTTYGLQQADDLGLVYGGHAGFDWHMRNRHHSFGIDGGARIYQNLEGADGEIAVGIHGSLYLRYVF